MNFKKINKVRRSIMWNDCSKQTATPSIYAVKQNLKLYRVEWSHMTNTIIKYGHYPKHAPFGQLNK